MRVSITEPQKIDGSTVDVDEVNMKVTIAIQYAIVTILQTLLFSWISMELRYSYTLIDAQGSFFMFVESGCNSTNIELTVP